MIKKKFLTKFCEGENNNIKKRKIKYSIAN